MLDRNLFLSTICDQPNFKHDIDVLDELYK